MAISIAFSGLGALLIHILEAKIKQRDEKLPSKIFQSTIAFAILVSIFLFVIGPIIPPNSSFLYLFYLDSSIPFFFTGISMALVYLAIPRSKQAIFC
jgi:hypothetical protein